MSGGGVIDLSPYALKTHNHDATYALKNHTHKQLFTFGAPENIEDRLAGLSASIKEDFLASFSTHGNTGELIDLLYSNQHFYTTSMNDLILVDHKYYSDTCQIDYAIIPNSGKIIAYRMYNWREVKWTKWQLCDDDMQTVSNLNYYYPPNCGNDDSTFDNFIDNKTEIIKHPKVFGHSLKLQKWLGYYVTVDTISYGTPGRNPSLYMQIAIGALEVATRWWAVGSTVTDDWHCGITHHMITDATNVTEQRMYVADARQLNPNVEGSLSYNIKWRLRTESIYNIITDYNGVYTTDITITQKKVVFAWCNVENCIVIPYYNRGINLCFQFRNADGDRLLANTGIHEIAYTYEQNYYV